MADRCNVDTFAYFLNAKEFEYQYGIKKSLGSLEYIFQRDNVDWHEAICRYWQENLSNEDLDNLTKWVKKERSKGIIKIDDIKHYLQGLAFDNYRIDYFCNKCNKLFANNYVKYRKYSYWTSLKGLCQTCCDEAAKVLELEFNLRAKVKESKLVMDLELGKNDRARYFGEEFKLGVDLELDEKFNDRARYFGVDKKELKIIYKRILELRYAGKKEDLAISHKVETNITFDDKVVI